RQRKRSPERSRQTHYRGQTTPRPDKRATIDVCALVLRWSPTGPPTRRAPQVCTDETREPLQLEGFFVSEGGHTLYPLLHDPPISNSRFPCDSSATARSHVYKQHLQVL